MSRRIDDPQSRGTAREAAEAEWSVWMASAQAGDSDAYERLLRAILPTVRAFVRSRMHNPDAAEDVVQNVLLSVHRSRHTYNASRPFGPWLRAVSRNAVIDSIRSRGRRLGREDPLEKHEAFLEAEPQKDYDAPISPGMIEALEKLPPNQRQAVEMLHLRELSVAEAAASVGVTPTAIKVRAHRGRVALKKHLGADSNDGKKS